PEARGPRWWFRQKREFVPLGGWGGPGPGGEVHLEGEPRPPGPFFGADDGGREQVARRALHHVLDQDTEPCSYRLPLSLRIVHKLDVGLAILEFLVRDHARARIVDRPAAR